MKIELLGSWVLGLGSLKKEAQMSQAITLVREAYDADPDREWQRLEGGAQARLEYLVNQHALAQYLPPPDGAHHTLDAGGGPGRYTLLLAARGYRTTLLDLSPALLDLARQRIAAAEIAVRERVDSVVAGSITDLSSFADATFGAVLCLGGPLSHLVDPADRERALAELRRVAQPGAPIFISVMNRFGPYRSSVQWPDCYDQFFPQLPATGIAAIGPHAAPTYFFLPEEFPETLRAAGLHVERVYGCNGLGAHIQEERLAALMADPARWPEWHELFLSTCDHPSIVGVSNHILAVARRP
jgi:SAM-dependent methyltransferase